MLNERFLAYLNYFETLAEQPPNHWDGFYIAAKEDRHYGLHFQVAFSCYALGALAMHPDCAPEEQERCRSAMASLIDRMLQRRIWAYWSLEAERRGLFADPVEHANVQYSGHLAMMIGLYEAVGGDQRYDEPFTLLWTSNLQFSYTHSSLVETIWQQMYENPHHGVDCAVGQTYTVHMNASMWAMLLHDQLHGSTYAYINQEWIAFVKEQLLIKGPQLPGRGVFGFLYLPRYRIPVRLGMNFVDAWTLAFLALIDTDLALELSMRFMKTIRHLPKPSASSPVSFGQAYVPSGRLWRRLELSDHSLTTGFCYLLAVHLGDTSLAATLLSYADHQLQPVEENGQRFYNAGLAAPYTTALFAMGEAGGLRPFVAQPPAATPPERHS
jgi:hypothetical protein